MAAETARLVGCPVEQVLVASTGVIGVALPIDKIRSGAAGGVSRRSAARPGRGGGARDHDHRSVSQGSGGRSSQIGGRDVRIGGMAKGSGMIEPMMATMLGFVTTDAAVPQRAARPRAARGGRRHLQRHHRRRRMLDQRLRDAARQRRQRRRRSTRRPTARFVAGLTAVCRELAMGIVRGGEGATKLVTVHRHRSGVDRATRGARPRRSRTRCSSRRRFTAAIPTGAGSSRWPAAPASRSSCRARRSRSDRPCCSRTAGRTTRRRRRRRRI